MGLSYNEEQQSLELKDTNGQVLLQWEHLTNYKDRKAFVEHILDRCRWGFGPYRIKSDVDSKIDHYRAQGYPYGRASSKVFGDIFGCSSTKLYSHYKKLSYKVFVAPYLEYLGKVFYSAHGLNISRLRCVRNNIEHLKQAKKDNQWNLMPFVVLTNKPVTELKKLVSSGVWKSLCKNSVSRNRLIMERLSHWHLRHDFIDRSGFGDSVLKPLLEVPSSLLDSRKGMGKVHIKSTPTECLIWLKNNREGTYLETVKKYGNLVRDTHHSFSQLGNRGKINTKWSVRRMKEEHDKAYRELVLEQERARARLREEQRARNLEYSKELDMTWLDTISVDGVVKGDFTAHLLRTSEEIVEEGYEMGHCVGSYANSVGKQYYLVYSIRKGGERSSTLGINVKDKPDYRIGVWNDNEVKVEKEKVLVQEKKKTFSFSQHYMKFNKPVVDEDEELLAQYVIEQLNKMSSTNQKEVGDECSTIN